MGTAPGKEQQFLYSPIVRVVENVSIPIKTSFEWAWGIGTNLEWDSYFRKLYIGINNGFTRQANELLRRGIITNAETRALVNQRNLLVKDMRKPLSPFGRLYSEILKPSESLPTHDQLLRIKGSNEAILSSIGKTRSYVDHLSVKMSYAGRGLVVINLTMSAYIIARAAPEDRARVASRQGGALVGGAIGGWGGAWAGCAGFSLLASSSLVVPVVGEGVTGGACLVGGLIGGFGGGAIMSWLGGNAGEAAYDYLTRLQWKHW